MNALFYPPRYVLRSRRTVTCLPGTTTNGTVSPSREDPASLEEKQQLPQSILRKYIMYAKQHCVPKLTNIDDAKFVKLYTELRKEAASSGGIQIAPRHIESMIRMAEAHAKMHLRDNVTTEDEDVAMRVVTLVPPCSKKLLRGSTDSIAT